MVAGAQGDNVIQIGDTRQHKSDYAFDLHLSAELRTWLHQHQISFAFTTYEGSKLISVAPGTSGQASVIERDFERCMALCQSPEGHLWVSTADQVWQLENGLDDGAKLDEWDRVFLPRRCHVTGNVDIHDLACGADGRLYGLMTQYSCIGTIGDDKGSFSPHWRPPFISAIEADDRCHLNGFCMDESGTPAYSTAVGTGDTPNSWKDEKADGGVIIDIRSNKILADGLSMPHTPRLFRNKLFFLESGRGYLCSLNLKNGDVTRHLWRPGFLRGLRFYKHYAFICSSAPRDDTFGDLPLADELAERGQEPQCAVEIIDMDRMQPVHDLKITGFVKEVYDVALLQNCAQPMLYGIYGNDTRNIIVLGPDETA